MSQSYPSSTSDRRYSGTTESVMDKASSAAQSVAEQGRHVASRAQEGAEDAYIATQRVIRQQPLTTVALSVAIGFALGALWKTGGYRQTWFDRMSNDYYEPAARSFRNASWWR